MVNACLYIIKLLVTIYKLTLPSYVLEISIALRKLLRIKVIGRGRGLRRLPVFERTP